MHALCAIDSHVLWQNLVSSQLCTTDKVDRYFERKIDMQGCIDDYEKSSMRHKICRKHEHCFKM